jgi:hypothetical protein
MPQIQQFHVIGAESLEAFFTLPPQRGWPTVMDRPPLGTANQPRLGGDHHFLPPVAQCPGDQPFAFTGAAVHVGRIEQVDAQIEAGPDRGDAVGVIDARAGHAGNRPAAQGDFGNLNAGIGQRTVVHRQEEREWQWLRSASHFHLHFRLDRRCLP